MSKTTEWLALDSPRHWFDIRCLRQHYDIPSDATEVRFVRGKNPDALHHEVGSIGEHYVTGHHDAANLDGLLGMLEKFKRWFGTKPGWVSVEWR